MKDPFFLGAAVLSAIFAIFAPPILNVVMIWCAYMYWKMSAR